MIEKIKALFKKDESDTIKALNTKIEELCDLEIEVIDQNIEKVKSIIEDPSCPGFEEFRVKLEAEIEDIKKIREKIRELGRLKNEINKVKEEFKRKFLFVLEHDYMPDLFCKIDALKNEIENSLPNSN